MRLLRRTMRAALLPLPSILLAILVAVGIAACGGKAPRSLLGVRPRATGASFTDTSDGIHVGLAFDYQAHDASAIAHSVDYIFGGVFVDWNFGFDPPVRHTDVYLPFDIDGYPQSIPGHSLQDWQSTHPDWIVYQCDRRTPAYYGSGNTNVPLDFTNPAVRQYQLQESETGFSKNANGVTFDDFSFVNTEGRCGVYRNGAWTPLGFPAQGQRSSTYDNAVMSWLRNMSTALKEQFPGKTLGLNVNLMTSGFDTVPLIAPYIDLLFDEGGFTSFGTNPLSGSTWTDEVKALEYLGDAGKAVDVNGIVDASSDATVSPDEINWVLSNYLLVKRNHTYTYIYAGDRQGFTGSPSTYGTFYDRPQYHIPIGQPTSARYEFSGAQVRYYSGGLVIVNPSSSETYTFPLNGTYLDMFGHRYSSSVTLSPVSGIVLLNG